MKILRFYSAFDGCRQGATRPGGPATLETRLWRAFVGGIQYFSFALTSALGFVKFLA